MQDHLNRFSDFLAWHASLPRQHSLPYEVVDLSDEPDFVTHLLSGNTALPSDPRLQSAAVESGNDDDWTTLRKQFRDDTVMERGAAWDDECKKVFVGDEAVKSAAQEQALFQSRVPSFSRVVDRVVEALKKLKGGRLSNLMDGVVVVGAFSTADDAGWATSTNTAACADLSDIFTTLTTSSKFIKDIQRQVAALNKRIYFVLRPFLDVNPSSEFRVFVEDGCVLGISQRCMDQLFPHLFPFAVPLTAEEGAEQGEAESEDDENGTETAAALKWSLEIEKCLLQHVVEPIISTSSEEEEEGEDDDNDANRWLSAPTLIVDILHSAPGCDGVFRAPVVLGVRAVHSLEDAVAGSSNRAEEIFRVFGSFASLRDWQNGALVFFQKRRDKNSESGTIEQLPSTLLRIATSSDDLVRDARAAHRGAAPLEFTDQAVFNQVMEQVKAVSAATGTNSHSLAVEKIVNARAAVHGGDGATTKQ